MAGTVDGQEAKLRVLPLGQVTSGLLVDGVDRPRVRSRSVTQVPDPALGTNGGTNRVIVTRVNKDVQAEATINQVVVDRGSRHLVSISSVVTNSVAALSPLDGRLDVKSGLDLGAVQVRHHVVVLARLVVISRLDTDILGLNASRLQLVVQLPQLLRVTSLERRAAISADRVIQSVRVQVSDAIDDGVRQSSTLASVRLNTLDALLDIGIIGRLSNQLMTPVGIDHSRGTTVRIGVRVSNRETLEVQLGVATSSVGINDLLGQGGHVVTAVRLRGDIQAVGAVLRETLEERLDQIVVIQSSLGITSGEISLIIGVAETNTGRGLDENHVGHGVPCVRIDLQVQILVRLERALLGHEACQQNSRNKQIILNT